MEEAGRTGSAFFTIEELQSKWSIKKWKYPYVDILKFENHIKMIFSMISEFYSDTKYTNTVICDMIKPDILGIR